MKHDASLTSPSTRLLRRLLVLGVCSSFLLSLVGIGIVNGFLNEIYRFLPNAAPVLVLNHITMVFVLPFVLLLICCMALVYSTRGIISGPTRYLDERQQLLRDKAHLMAYRIIILICVIAGAGIILHMTFGVPSTTDTQLLMFSLHGSPAQGGSLSVITRVNSLSSPPHITFIDQMPASTQSLPVQTMGTISLLSQPGAEASSTYIWSYSLLFASCLMLIGTLPRSIIAWKNQL